MLHRLWKCLKKLGFIGGVGDRLKFVVFWGYILFQDVIDGLCDGNGDKLPEELLEARSDANCARGFVGLLDTDWTSTRPEVRGFGRFVRIGQRVER